MNENFFGDLERNLNSLKDLSENIQELIKQNGKEGSKIFPDFDVKYIYKIVESLKKYSDGSIAIYDFILSIMSNTSNKDIIGTLYENILKNFLTNFNYIVNKNTINMDVTSLEDTIKKLDEQLSKQVSESDRIIRTREEHKNKKNELEEITKNNEENKQKIIELEENIRKLEAQSPENIYRIIQEKTNTIKSKREQLDRIKLYELTQKQTKLKEIENEYDEIKAKKEEIEKRITSVEQNIEQLKNTMKAKYNENELNSVLNELNKIITNGVK